MVSASLLKTTTSWALLCTALNLQCSAQAVSQEKDCQACVTLVKYSNRKCSGKPVGENTFTTQTAPGSPCKHTTKMGQNSAKDQYCVLDKDIFKQTVYISDKHCHVNIWEKAISPMHLVYSKKECVYGYKLGSCTPGPCAAGNNEDAEPNFLHFPLLRKKEETF